MALKKAVTSGFRSTTTMSTNQSMGVYDLAEAGKLAAGDPRAVEKFEAAWKEARAAMMDSMLNGLDEMVRRQIAKFMVMGGDTKAEEVKAWEHSQYYAITFALFSIVSVARRCTTLCELTKLQESIRAFHEMLHRFAPTLNNQADHAEYELLNPAARSFSFVSTVHPIGSGSSSADDPLGMYTKVSNLINPDNEASAAEFEAWVKKLNVEV